MQITYMVLGKLTKNTQKNRNQNSNFEIEILKQTMDSVATVKSALSSKLEKLDSHHSIMNSI